MKWYLLKIHFPGSESIPEDFYEDEVLGASVEDALDWAIQHWPTADSIEVIPA